MLSKGIEIDHLIYLFIYQFITSLRVVFSESLCGLFFMNFKLSA